ncbi:MATE family efflux transporter [Pseudodesulfovibrio pelocollis]|uniref:MATE family efflux transporter n=1 Tax=Pseudodesulfovibrio pelocollis TaxID=3051432 RepID=UPI00255B0A02|nr:MATE family efflux transporter [Pseudodesulfovibrio sp. SB368]
MSAAPMNMGEGRVLSVLLRLGGPAMVSMFFQNLYSLVDTVFVSWLGTAELAALSLSVPLFYVALSLCKGLAVGSTALMSHARGAGDQAGAGVVARAALPLALLVLTPFCLLALPALNQPLFALFGVGGDVLEPAGEFVFWLAWTFPVMGFAMLCESVFLSHGDARTPMLAMIAGNVVNIGLDPLLIFTCKMGIAGASLASLIGWGVTGAILFTVLGRRGMDRPTLTCGREGVAAWGGMVRLGFPVSLTMLIIPASTAGLNYVLAGFGPAFVGAWNLSSRMEQMLILPIYGLTCALIPFVGFNMGQGNMERIREAVRLCIRACYAVLIPVAVLMGVFVHAVFAVFNPGPEVATLAAHAFRLALIGMALAPFDLVVLGVAQGARRPGYSLFLGFVRLLALRLPLAFLFGHLLGGEGVYLSHPASLVASGLLSLYLLRRLLSHVDETIAAGAHRVAA